MTEEAIISLSAVELGAAIRLRRVSCVDVMTAYLNRIDKTNPKVNAIVNLQPRELLLRQAMEKDDLLASGHCMGPLHGFPLAPKDLTDTKDIFTTSGAVFLSSYLPPSDSIIVERMRRAGAIFIGKTNVPQFGLGSHTFNTLHGTTANAYDHSKSAGGSSGGAAVALALKMLPVADGNMGSLRNPAAFNNVYGFRPTATGNTVPSSSAEIFFQTESTDGPMGRSVEDVFLLLSVLAGPADSQWGFSRPRDPRLDLPVPAFIALSNSLDLSRVRVGWLGDLNKYLPFEDGVLQLSEGTVKRVIGGAMGCVVDFDAAGKLGFDMKRLWSAFVVLRHFLVMGRMKAHYDRPERRKHLNSFNIWEIEQGLALTPAALYAASVVRSNWYREMMRMFVLYDYLVLPSAQVWPFDKRVEFPDHLRGNNKTYHSWMECVIGPTMAGLPVLSVPAGFSPTSGLPNGFQIIARPGADVDLLLFGYCYQQHRLKTADQSRM